MNKNKITLEITKENDYFLWSLINGTNLENPKAIKDYIAESIYNSNSLLGYDDSEIISVDSPSQVVKSLQPTDLKAKEDSLKKNILEQITTLAIAYSNGECEFGIESTKSGKELQLNSDNPIGWIIYNALILNAIEGINKN